MCIAILENDNVLYFYQEELKKDMVSKVIPTIESAFQRVPFSLQEIDRIYVVNGPGSFTGVRIGVSIAKIMAWALKKEIVALSSLEFLATTSVSTKYSIPAIDARRGYVYAGVYDSKLNVIMQDRYMLFSELEEYLKEGTIISHDTLNNKINPDVNVSSIVRKHQFDSTLNPHEVKPNYLKLTEAEEKRLVGV